MNRLETHVMESPYRKQEECAAFIIDDVADRFVLQDVMTPETTYTLSFWIKSEISYDYDATVTLCDRFVYPDSNWQRVSLTFYASESDIRWEFDTMGTYYIYRPKLEIGDKATDWTPAPEDLEEAAEEAQSSADNALFQASNLEAHLRILEDRIATLVRSKDGGTLAEQHKDGFYWIFDISEVREDVDKSISDISELKSDVNIEKGKVEALTNKVDDLIGRTEYVRSYVNENDQPCLELGEGDSDFKVLITNTMIEFMDGNYRPAYIGNKKLNIETAQVKGELQVGDDEDDTQEGIFVWSVRQNGNLGLTWRPKELVTNTAEVIE